MLTCLSLCPWPRAVQNCRSSEEEFREAQCALTDSTPMNGQTHHWVPVNMLGKREAQCALTDSTPMNGQTHHWVPVNMLGKRDACQHAG